jgi:hypothetical protein
LGTIVGFYFGSSPDNKSGQTTIVENQPQALTIAPASISNSQPKKGDKITILSFVSGGKPPYTYSLTFDPPIIAPIKNVPTSSGWIIQDVVVPTNIDIDKDVKFLIAVKDGDNKAVDSNKDPSQKISIKAK